MRRKISLRFLVFGFATVMLIMFCISRALHKLAPPPSSSASSSVSLVIEPGYTNFYGRFAYVVVTNLSNSDFRLYGSAGFQGTPPTRVSGNRMLGDHFILLGRHSFYRFPIEAPTNGIPWSGMVTLSPDSEYYRIADKILTRLQNSRFELIKLFAKIVAPRVRSEDLFSETR
jgi:hypothetical protein